MGQRAALRRDALSEFGSKMYDGDLHAKRVLSLSNATLGVLTRAPLAIHAAGYGLAQAMGTFGKHGIKHVERSFGYRVPYMLGVRHDNAVVLDWASFARNGQETIVISTRTCDSGWECRRCASDTARALTARWRSAGCR